jgi:hypothetical protein
MRRFVAVAELVHVNAAANPTARWAARQIIAAFPYDSAPRHLIRDRGAIFGEAFHQRVSTRQAPPQQSPILVQQMGSTSDRLAADERMADRCREYGISRETGHKFKERFERQGLDRLAEVVILEQSLRQVTKQERIDFTVDQRARLGCWAKPSRQWSAGRDARCGTTNAYRRSLGVHPLRNHNVLAGQSRPLVALRPRQQS